MLNSSVATIRNLKYLVSLHIVCVVVLIVLVIVLFPDEGSKAVAESGRGTPGKSTKQSSQKKGGPSCVSPVATDKNAGNRPLDKDRKMDAPSPRMQFDDKSRLEKARRCAVVNPTESRNKVELFQHLPQYEYGTQLPNLESKFFQIGSVHPAVFEVLFFGNNAHGISLLTRTVTYVI